MPARRGKRRGVLTLKVQDHCYHSSMEEKDRRQLLLEVYGIERQSDQNSSVVVFAIIAAALTYVVASAGFLLGHYTSAGYTNIPSVVLLLSPLVIVALLSSLVLTVSANAIRGKHLKELEKQVKVEVEVEVEVGKNVSFPSSIRDASDIWEIKRSLSWLRVYAILTLTTYLPLFVLAWAYIFAVLIPGPWSGYKKAAFIFYSFVIAAQAAGLLVASFHPRFKKDYNAN